MEIDINKQEAWKILDALVAYKKDYTLTGPVNKIFDNITKKLKEVVKEWLLFSGWLHYSVWALSIILRAMNSGV